MLLLVRKNVSLPPCPHASSLQSGSNNLFTTVAPKILEQSIKKFVLFRSLRAFVVRLSQHFFPLNIFSLFSVYVPFFFVSLLSASQSEHLSPGIMIHRLLKGSQQSYAVPLHIQITQIHQTHEMKWCYLFCCSLFCLIDSNFFLI